MKTRRAALLALGAAALLWIAWDTDADPVRFLRGVPWMLDFIRRMMPPDLAVLPAALAGALKTFEIALLGTTAAAAIAVPLGLLSARNVAPPSLYYPVRAGLNFFRSIDTLVYALLFVAAEPALDALVQAGAWTLPLDRPDLRAVVAAVQGVGQPDSSARVA